MGSLPTTTSHCAVLAFRYDSSQAHCTVLMGGFAFRLKSASLRRCRPLDACSVDGP